MKVAIRRVGKWFLWGLGAVVVLFGLYLSVFFFPYPLFPHHIEHAGFSVYSDREIPEDFERILDEARFRVEGMELYRGAKDLRIFVCQSQRLFVFINKLAGKRHTGQALVISVAGNAFFSEAGDRGCRATKRWSPRTLEARGIVVCGDRSRGRTRSGFFGSRIRKGAANPGLEIGGLCRLLGQSRVRRGGSRLRFPKPNWTPPRRRFLAINHGSSLIAAISGGTFWWSFYVL